jgi:uncharacterized protein (DUF1015 family)
MRIQPIHILQPPPERARDVASLPYDVGELEDARREAVANPSSFLHVERPEVDLPADFDPDSGIHHQTARRNLERLQRSGDLAPAATPALYVYRITMGAHAQTGVVGGFHVEDYYADLIKKHEKTKKPTEDDRTRHILEVGAQTGPIFLLHPDRSSIDAAVARIVAAPARIDFVARDGIRHEVWPVPDPTPIQEAFSEVPCVYVADGHHRAAAAARAGRERAAANSAHNGNEPYNWVLAAAFPASQLQVLAYNRLLKDLNGLSATDFLAEVRRRFDVAETTASRPACAARVHMRFRGEWYALSWKPDPSADLVSALDVSVLQDRLLGPVLGIADPRNNSRIEYVGGVDGAEEVRARVDAGRAAVGFSLFPTDVRQLMAIADAGHIMPPKSTWFEPKLRSGLFVHPLS